MSDDVKKGLYWCRSSKKDFMGFPEEVHDDIGYGIHRVQCGEMPGSYSYLSGIGSGVIEIKADHDSDTYRVVYVAKFEEAVYILDAFQKKSPHGKKLPRNIMSRIKARYDEVKKDRPAKLQAG